MRGLSWMTGGLILLALAGPSLAEPTAQPAVALDIRNAEIGFRVYGFGLMPVNGHFTRFRGSWHGDPHDPAACTVELGADIASLVMPTDGMRNDALAPGMLDSATFPQMSFQGRCAGGRISGELTLHGFRGAMDFAVTRGSGKISAEGSLRRAEWGMTANNAMVGGTVYIEINMRDPALSAR